MARTWWFKPANASLWTGWQSAEALGVSGLAFRYRHLGADECTFAVDGDGLANALWTYDSIVMVRYAESADVETGETWLVGRVSTVPRQLKGSAESVRYSIVGGMAWLERATYQQSWQAVRASDGETVSIPKPRVVLGQSSAGARITTGGQIADALAVAAARGIPLLVDAGMAALGIAVPYDERENLKVADVVDWAMKWMPDHKLVWDYGTNDGTDWVPTVRLRGPTGNAKTLAATDCEEIDLSPRPDLVIPGVRIVYEIAHDVDGDTFNSYSLDEAGDVDDEDAASLSFDLAGSSRSYVSQAVATETYGTEPETLDWWKRWAPWLAAMDPDDVTIRDVTRSGAHEYPRWAVDGAVPSWVGASEREVWRAMVDYVVMDGEAVVETGSKEISVELLSTGASTRTYRRLTSYASGESVPSGVAAALLASWSFLHYEGKVSAAYEDFPVASAWPRPWDFPQINISGGRAEWAAMAANVQGCEVDADSGLCSWSVGPCAALGADDRVALYRALRSRRYAWSRAGRTDAGAASDEVAGAEGLPLQAGADGDPGIRSRLVVRAGDPLHAIDLHPAGIAFADPLHEAAQTLQPRELRVIVDDSGTLKAKLVQVLASAPYGDAEAVGGGAAVPNGTALGQILYWDPTTTPAGWKVSAVGTLAPGDVLQWDGSKYVKLTPAAATVVGIPIQQGRPQV